MGWVDQVMNHAKGQSLAVCPTEPGSAADPLSSLLGNCTETANTQNPLNFDSLQDSVQNFAAGKSSPDSIQLLTRLTIIGSGLFYATDTLPTDIRQAVLKEVQAYVNSQLQR